MARSKFGGTRAMTRGKVGREVYQVSYAADGRAKQIVRAAEESRVNPQTDSQQRARLAMAVVMSAMRSLRPVISHSFEGVDVGQPSFSRFSSFNRELVGADMAVNWVQDSLFCYPEKSKVFAYPGAFIMSDGSITQSAFGAVEFVSPSNIRLSEHMLVLFRELPTHATVADFKAVTGWQAGDYVTFIMLMVGALPEQNFFTYFRVSLSSIVPDSAELSEDVVIDLFDIYETEEAQVLWEEETKQVVIDFSPSSAHAGYSIASWGIIESRYINGRWCKSYCQLANRWSSKRIQQAWNAPEDVWHTWFDADS